VINLLVILEMIITAWMSMVFASSFFSFFPFSFCLGCSLSHDRLLSKKQQKHVTLPCVMETLINMNRWNLSSHPKEETLTQDVWEHRVEENNWDYKTGSKSMMGEKKIIICILHQISLGWSHQSESAEQEMRYVYRRWEVCINSGQTGLKTFFITC
jgi:hypothetical protein